MSRMIDREYFSRETRRVYPIYERVEVAPGRDAVEVMGEHDVDAEIVANGEGVDLKTILSRFGYTSEQQRELAKAPVEYLGIDDYSGMPEDLGAAYRVVEKAKEIYAKADKNLFPTFESFLDPRVLGASDHKKMSEKSEGTAGKTDGDGGKTE